MSSKKDIKLKHLFDPMCDDCCETNKKTIENEQDYIMQKLKNVVKQQ